MFLEFGKDTSDKWSSKEDLETECHWEVAYQLLQPYSNHFTVDAGEENGSSHGHHWTHQTNDHG